MRSVRTTLSLVAAAVTVASAATKCGPGNLCPESAPCCSQYGQCGVGAYCLGGCDPLSSFNLDSCMAAPACQSQDYKMTSLDDISPNTQYLGDSSKANWVSSGTPVAYNGDAILLTMAPSTVGTLLTSTHYVWYGKVSATMTTSQGAGVVSAFILMSDVKDEIDFEFVGVDLENAQSNYYYQGVTDYHNEVNLTVSNTQQNVHTYEIDWTPDSITWSIDGNAMRTLKKSDTYNSTDKQYHYPQTPARVQLSLWPAGLASNGQGTIDWAGGLVNWDSPLMQNGYYYAMFQDVNVQCYDPPSGYQNLGTKSYAYMSGGGEQNTVAITNNNTILDSFEATGNNPTLGKPQSSGTASASSSQQTSASDNSVPGVVGGGTASTGQSPVDNGGSSGGSGGSSSTAQGLSGGGGSAFVQGNQVTSAATKMVTGLVVSLVAVFAAALLL